MQNFTYDLSLFFFLPGCRSKGIFFVAIDLNRPLTEQGPFDILLHKVRVCCQLSF